MDLPLTGQIHLIPRCFQPQNITLMGQFLLFWIGFIDMVDMVNHNTIVEEPLIKSPSSYDGYIMLDITFRKITIEYGRACRQV
jgi:hypothetical protein